MRDLLPSDLINFEEKIAGLFNEGKIPFPIHLSNGNEESIIDIFRSIKSSDWIFSSWRSHYHCLLKGVPEAELENAILEGRSIALNFPDYRIYSSAIVTGQIPQAVGVAMAIKILRNAISQCLLALGVKRHQYIFHLMMTKGIEVLQALIIYLPLMLAH